MREDDAVIVTCPFEGANLVFARIDEMLPRDKPCFTTALGPHGGSFIRTGDGDRRMTSYEVDRLIEEHQLWFCRHQHADFKPLFLSM